MTSRSTAALISLMSIIAVRPAAGDAPPAAPELVPGHAVPSLPKAPAGHQVVTMWLDAGDPQAGIAAGYTKVESTTVTCPQSPGTCTLALSVMDQVYYPPGDEYWAIVVSVDGNIVDGGPYQNLLPSEGNDIGNWSGAVAVKAGRHKVELRTYSQTNAYQGHWSVNWTVTTP